MTNDIATRSPASANVNRLLDTFQIEVYGFDDVAIDRRPDQNEMAILQPRLRELNTLLRPINMSGADRDKAVKALALLFSGYPSMRNANATDTITPYMLHLDHLPLLALCQACEDISKGRVADLDPDFPPTSPRMAKVAEKHLVPLARERDRIEQIVGARKLMSASVTPEMQQRVRDSLRQLADSLSEAEGKRHQQIVAKMAKADADWQTKHMLRQYEQIGAKPAYISWRGERLLVSPELLESLGKPVKGRNDGRSKSTARR